MGNAVLLNENEKKIFDDLKIVFDKLWNNKSKDVQADFIEMEKLARALHISLKDRNITPKHHAYMIENRGLNPDEEGFYEHLHPVEDLFKFIDDQSANDDPEDITIGETFNFNIYTKRWGHEDNFRLTRTSNGWDLTYFQGPKECNTEGYPYLYKELANELVSYPVSLKYYLSDIWEMAKDEGLSKERVQELLSKVADWVSMCEKNKPELR